MSELADKERRAIKILRMYRSDDPIDGLVEYAKEYIEKLAKDKEINL
jgi:hypothetical protein